MVWFGGSSHPCFKSLGLEARQAPDVYEPPDGCGSSWWQAVVIFIHFVEENTFT